MSKSKKPDVEPVTEPVTTEPVIAEPVQVKPAFVEPVVAEPVTTEPVAVEPVTAEPVTAEPVLAGDLNDVLNGVEPVTAEPVTTESVTTEPVAKPVEVSTSEKLLQKLGASPKLAKFLLDNYDIDEVVGSNGRINTSLLGKFDTVQHPVERVVAEDSFETGLEKFWNSLN